MVSVNRALADLRAQRGRAKDELDQLDKAISVLEQLVGGGGVRRSTRVRARRALSAAARQRIAEAQKARWAQFRKSKAKA